MKEEENKSLQKNVIDDLKVVNESEILSDEIQESIDGGVEAERLQDSEDWCICNNLTINGSSKDR